MSILKLGERHLPKLFWTNLHVTKHKVFILSKLILGRNWKYSTSYRSGRKLSGVKSSKVPSQKQMSVLDRRSSPPNSLSRENSSQGYVHSDHLESEQSGSHWILVGGLSQFAPFLAFNSFPWNYLCSKSELPLLMLNRRAQVPGGFKSFGVSFTHLPKTSTWLISDFLKNYLLVAQESPPYLQFLSGPLRHAGKRGVRKQGAKVRETSAFPLLLLPECSFPASVVPEIFQAYNG